MTNLRTHNHIANPEELNSPSIIQIRWVLINGTGKIPPLNSYRHLAIKENLLRRCLKVAFVQKDCRSSCDGTPWAPWAEARNDKRAFRSPIRSVSGEASRK